MVSGHGSLVTGFSICGQGPMKPFRLLPLAVLVELTVMSFGRAVETHRD